MSFEEDLQAELVSHLDLEDFSRVQRQTPIENVLETMRREHLSAVLIEEDGVLVGIFTERDVLLKVADVPEVWDRPVEAFMTPAPQTLHKDNTVGQALRLMNEGHYRNVPVLDKQGHIAGNLSQKSIIRFLTDRFPRDIYNLPPDPEVVPQTKEGA